MDQPIESEEMGINREAPERIELHGLTQDGDAVANGWHQRNDPQTGAMQLRTPSGEIIEGKIAFEIFQAITEANARAFELAAKAVNDFGAEREREFGLSRAVQDLYRARDRIRALAR